METVHMLDPTDPAQQKIMSLIQLCEEYLAYLQAGKTPEEIRGDMKNDYEVITLILHKIQITNELKNSLTIESFSPAEKIKQFKLLLDKNEPILKSNIDNDIIFAVKEFIDKKTQGGAGKLGLWRVRGAEFVEQINLLLTDKK